LSYVIIINNIITIIIIITGDIAEALIESFHAVDDTLEDLVSYDDDDNDNDNDDNLR